MKVISCFRIAEKEICKELWSPISMENMPLFIFFFSLADDPYVGEFDPPLVTHYHDFASY